jgi:hypothetical protein
MANTSTCGKEIPNKEHHRGRTDGFYQQVGEHGCFCNGYKDGHVWLDPDLVQDFEFILMCSLLGAKSFVIRRFNHATDGIDNNECTGSSQLYLSLAN